MRRTIDLVKLVINKWKTNIIGEQKKEKWKGLELKNFNHSESISILGTNCSTLSSYHSKIRISH